MPNFMDLLKRKFGGMGGLGGQPNPGIVPGGTDQMGLPMSPIDLSMMPGVTQQGPSRMQQFAKLGGMLSGQPGQQQGMGQGLMAAGKQQAPQMPMETGGQPYRPPPMSIDQLMQLYLRNQGQAPRGLLGGR